MIHILTLLLSVNCWTLKAKERAFRWKKANPTPENIACFKQSRYEFKNLVKIKYANYLKSITGDTGKNPKSFWSFIKARSIPSTFLAFSSTKLKFRT